MHLPDAFVFPATALAFGGVAAGAAAVATARTVRDPALDRKLSLMAALAALVFALRLVRFPIVGTGACGHVVGGLLAAIVVGPEAGFLVLLAVQVIQALVFADGGLIALGANVVNGAFWPAWVGLPVYRRLAGPDGGMSRQLGAVLVASLVSLELGAMGVAVAVGGTGLPEFVSARFLVVVVAAHVPMAIVEAIVTTAVLLALRRPSAGWRAGDPLRAGGSIALGLFAVALFAAVVLADFASRRPEWPAWSLAASRPTAVAPAPVAEASAAFQARIALFPGYGSPRLAELAPAAASTIAGLFGALASAGLALVPGLIVRARRALRRA